ncbi:hypothetical protein OG279_09670 [Streptomyces sp. NBC_01201]|uniref:hypothetical protein n=1 Tax=Streptomyces sp. NBC_01201 TaxID=2903770 RepID=UPI002E131A6A|nr:hypothetical protein OG279_09670 [Streptomyces sp. NBC_01201]
MATRLTFLLDARDGASRVMDRIGDNANRMGRRMLAASINGDAAMRRLGNSTTRSMAGLQRDTDIGARAAEALKGALISLAPAAVPMAASLAPIAPAVGAAAVATAAYAAALGPQVVAMTEAAEAEKKYADEVQKSGRTSEAAVQAQMEYVRAVADLPPATRRAAAGLSVLKDEYKQWSDSLAEDTMGPVTKGMAIFTALLPQTTGLAKGASAQLDRMMTILAGGMSSPGLDGLNQRFTDFATTTLSRVNLALVNLMRNTDTGKVGGGVSEFMDYARAQGPVVADTLRNLGQALMNVLNATSEVGVGMLQVVNGLAGIVSAVPPGTIATMLQLAIAIKAIRLAAVGLAAGRTAVAAFGASLVAMQTAAAAAPGRMAAVTAAWGAMSRGARLAAAGTGVGLLVIAMMELSQIGKKAPADIDKLTSSLGQFAESGKVAGEAARLFGADLGGLVTALNVVPQRGQDVDEFFKKFKDNPTSIKDAKKQVEALDKSLASMVSSGKGDLAASALARIKAEMVGAGMSTSGLNGKLTEYKDALAAAAFEQQLVVQSMGLFGAQAQQVQEKLNAQKASADGLRQSIAALNDVQRQGLGGMIGFEAAIDAATEAIKGHGSALSMTGGKLNLNSEKSREAATALNDLAAKTDEAAAQARESGASWETVNGIYARGRAALIRSADAMGLTKSQAAALADQILKTPDKTAKLKGNLEDLEGKLATAKGKLAKLPDSRQAKVRAEISDLQNKIARAQAALANLRDRSVTVTTRYVVVGDASAARKAGSAGSQLKYADGGLVGYPGGGMVTGPGTGTSDSILARVSNNEYVVKAKSVAKYGVAFMNALNEGRLGMASTVGEAGSGLAGAGLQAGRGLGLGLRAAAAGVDSAARFMAAAVEAGIRAELLIASPSKKTKALAKDVGKGFIQGLTGSKAKIAAVAKDLVKDITAAWKGVNTSKDSRLIAMVNRDTKKLQTLATKRDTLASKIAGAKQYAKDWTAGAREDASLGNLGIEEGEVTAGSIQGALSQKLAKFKQFTSYITTLGKRGLAKSMLKQILVMGPEAGFAYASALAGASSTTLKSINSLQYSINAETDRLGKTGADVMYDSGKNAGKGFLTGLTSQQKAIEAQMLKIAKGMDKAIRKALGIKSPSRVMAQLGRYTTEGLAVGMRERLPVLDGALAAVSGRVAATQPVIGRPAVVGAGAGGVVYQIHVEVRDAMDPVAVGREMQRVLVKYGRTQGATVQLKVG